MYHNKVFLWYHYLYYLFDIVVSFLQFYCHNEQNWTSFLNNVIVTNEHQKITANYICIHALTYVCNLILLLYKKISLRWKYKTFPIKGLIISLTSHIWSRFPYAISSFMFHVFHGCRRPHGTDFCLTSLPKVIMSYSIPLLRLSIQDVFLLSFRILPSIYRDCKN